LTLKDREDLFIENCRKTFGRLTFEAEALLRHGYGCGARELESVARAAGIDEQQERVLMALGAHPAAKKVSP